MRKGDLINLQDDFERFFKITEERGTGSGQSIQSASNPQALSSREPASDLDRIQVLLRNALLPPFTGVIDNKPILKPRAINFQEMLISSGIINYAGEHGDPFFLKLGHLFQDADRLVRQCEMCGRVLFEGAPSEVLLAYLYACDE